MKLNKEISQIKAIRKYGSDCRFNNYKNGGCSDEYYTPNEYFIDALSDFNKIFELNILKEQCDINTTFYYGGDYQNKKYSPNKIILDNPPFSKLREITNFFIKNNIKFILFMSNCCFLKEHIERNGWESKNNLSFLMNWRSIGKDSKYKWINNNEKTISITLISNIPQVKKYICFRKKKEPYEWKPKDNSTQE